MKTVLRAVFFVILCTVLLARPKTEHDQDSAKQRARDADNTFMLDGSPKDERPTDITKNGKKDISKSGRFEEVDPPLSPTAENDVDDDNWYSCGDDRCLCNSTFANCRNRTDYIPTFPENIVQLDFRHNNLTTIEDKFFFSNVTNITFLDIGDNGLTKIKDGDLSLLTQLKILYISHNHFTHFDNFTGALLNTLEELRVFHVGLRLSGMHHDVFNKHRMPLLRTLYLHDNELAFVHLDVFSPLENLQNLGIADNLINNFYIGLLRNVTRMVLEANSVRIFLLTCWNRTEESAYPMLTHLNLAYNNIHEISKKVCLPKLEFLSLKGNSLCIFYPHTFGVSKFPALSLLLLESQCPRCTTKHFKNYAFFNSSMRYLYLGYNNINFDDEKEVENQTFAGCTNVKKLHILHNYITRSQRLVQLFGDMVQLQTISLGHVGLQDVDSIGHFRRLRNISLYHNELSDVPDGVFDSLKELTFLVLSNNLISTIRPATFSNATRKRLKSLDLGSDFHGFQCGCDLVWFADWLRSRPALFKSNFSYDCANIPGTTVQAFHINEQQCLMSRFTATLFAVCSGLLITAMLVFIVFFRYRWHLRLLCFDAFRSRNATARWRRLQQHQFKYDVFVSYAGEDLNWVRTYLQPELEGKLGLRLCLHERDFTPGEPIVDNIALSVEASKKVLMLFSKHFARSHWCQFELHFCLSHVMDYDDSLIVTCLHDIPSRDLTSAMMAVFKTQTYLQWRGNDDDARMAFWGRLRVALYEILPFADRIGN